MEYPLSHSPSVFIFFYSDIYTTPSSMNPRTYNTVNYERHSLSLVHKLVLLLFTKERNVDKKKTVGRLRLLSRETYVK
jgi:hypothetical protein